MNSFSGYFSSHLFAYAALPSQRQFENCRCEGISVNLNNNERFQIDLIVLGGITVEFPLIVRAENSGAAPQKP